MTPAEWRHLWRKRGLLVDHLLPHALLVPNEESCQDRVPATVLVPGDKKRSTVSDDDKEMVIHSVDWIVGFIAESLPARVLTPDMKPLLPGIASALAVQSIDGETEFLGSFDILVRIHAQRNAAWKKYHNQEGVIDVKLSGSSQPFGLSSATMLRHLIKGRAVLKAAKQNKSRVGRCAFVAYLLRRPPGPTFKGRGNHQGGWALVGYDAKVWMDWDPSASKGPRPFLVWGELLVAGSHDEPEGLQAPLPPPRRVAATRWEVLVKDAQRGWVDVQKLVQVFGLQKKGELKHATARAMKRLSDNDCLLIDSTKHDGRGRPPKRARLCDLKRVYSDLE